MKHYEINIKFSFSFHFHKYIFYFRKNSFPSDHTTFTLSIALMLLSFKSARVIAIVATFFALWCGIARVYAGVHYPFDILGSVVISILAVIVIMALKNKLIVLNNFVISIWQKIIRK